MDTGFVISDDSLVLILGEILGNVDGILLGKLLIESLGPDVGNPEGAEDVALGTKLPETLGTEEGKLDWIEVELALGMVVDENIGLLEGGLMGLLLGFTLGIEVTNIDGIELG